MLETILHPSDFSDTSEFAFKLACSLARDYNARLILLHVVPPSTAPLLSAPPANPLIPAEAQEAFIGKFAWPQPPEPNIMVEHRVAEGDAPTEILRLAQTINCRRIVMGSQGRTGLSRLLIGSVAEEVLRKSACPVLVAKKPSSATVLPTSPAGKPAQ